MSEVLYLIVIEMYMIVEGVRGRRASDLSHELARPDGKQSTGCNMLGRGTTR